MVPPQLLLLLLQAGFWAPLLPTGCGGFGPLSLGYFRSGLDEGPRSVPWLKQMGGEKVALSKMTGENG